MDADQGHQIVSRTLLDDNAPLKMLIGDRNADRDTMRSIYNMSHIISTTEDPLTHIASDKG
jgi:hypothetical protein